MQVFAGRLGRLEPSNSGIAAKPAPLATHESTSGVNRGHHRRLQFAVASPIGRQFPVPHRLSGSFRQASRSVEEFTNFVGKSRCHPFAKTGLDATVHFFQRPLQTDLRDDALAVSRETIAKGGEAPSRTLNDLEGTNDTPGVIGLDA